MNTYLQMHWGAIFFLVLAILYIIYRLGPWNWRFVANRWTGLRIRLGRAVGELLGEGPVLILRPFERLVKVPLFDLKIRIKMPNQPTAAPNPQYVDLEIVPVIKFADPIAVIQSVPDRDPIDEVKDFFRAATRAAIQARTIVELSEKGAVDILLEDIKRRLDIQPIFKRWGIQVVSLEIKDLIFSRPFMAAQNAVVEAEGDAQATKIRANAQAEAADRLGNASRTGVAAIMFDKQQDSRVQQAKAGALRTFVQLADDGIGGFLNDLGILKGGK